MWYTWSCTPPPTQSKSWLIVYLCCNVKLSKLVPSKPRKGSSKHISLNWGFSQNIQSIIPGRVFCSVLSVSDKNHLRLLASNRRLKLAVFRYLASHHDQQNIHRGLQLHSKNYCVAYTQKQALQSVVVNYTCLCVQLLFYFWPVSNSCKGELRKHGWGDSPVGRLTFLPTSRQSVWNVGGGVTTWGRISIWGVA